MRMHRWLLALALASLPPLEVLAGAFGVSPIRVDLDPATRTGLVTVVNDDDRKLYFQLKLVEWTQSPEGEDRYADSSDLLFFPQIFTLEPKDKRLIRIGVKAPPAGPERAYRLFIEELPDPNAGPSGGAQVAVRLRFGVPVFVSGGKGDPKAVITSATDSPGAVQLAIRNEGTRQVRFETIALRRDGRELASAAGWYVFPGTTRTFSIPVGGAPCPAPGAAEVVATSTGHEVRTTVEISPRLCVR